MAEEEARTQRLQELRSLCDEEPGNVDPRLKALVTHFASGVLDRELHPFQIDGVSYLLNGAVQDKVMAMVIPPGGGKSLSYIITGCMSLGVTVIMEPTLTLGADQLAKLKEVKEMARVTAYNLDDYKTEASWDAVVKDLRSLLDLPSKSLPVVFLVVSPQCVSDTKRPWRQLLLDLAKAEVLRLMVLDELHLVREQGESLRPEFTKAGETVFAEVKKACPKIPLALYTGTCELVDLAVVENICKSQITRIIWAPPREFSKRGVKVSMVCRSVYSAVAKTIATPIIMHPKKRMISYTDFKVDVTKTADTLRSIAAKHEVPFDVLEICGTDPPEQKAMNINLFCQNTMTTEDEKAASKLYRGLTATSGSASTGIDPPEVALVSRRGCPPSLAVMFQEQGRLLRNDLVPGWEYTYHMMIDVNSYARLVWRTETSSKATRSEKDRNLSDHLRALKAIVLSKTCLASTLEAAFGRPGSTDRLPPSCGNQCPICGGERDAETAMFDVTALQASLFDIFSDPRAPVKIGNTQKDSNFVSKLREVGLKKKVWLDSRSSRDGVKEARTSIEAHFVDMLVLQLIAAGYIEVVTSLEKEKDGTMSTVVSVRGVKNGNGTGFLFSSPTAFNGDIPKATR